MLEMRPVYTAYEREEYTAPFGFVPEDEDIIVCARYPDRFVGMACVRADGENGEIRRFSLIEGYEDDTDLFLLGKAMLNVLDLRGVKTVVYNAPENEAMAKRLGFKKAEGGALTLSLEGYFTGHHA